MSLVCCLDTNAILDMCYRYYPSNSFKNLWGGLESAVIAGQISFIQSEHISKEVDRKIVQFDYSRANYDELLELFKVEKISVNDYVQVLNELKGSLRSNVPFISKKASAMVFLDNLDEDLSNISVAYIKKAKVITSEQGFGQDITSPVLSKRTPLKIPDVCTYKNIPCSNWIEVFRYLGLTC